MSQADELNIVREKSEDGETLTFKPGNDLLASNSDIFRRTIMNGIEDGVKTLVVDLADVRFIDSTGLGVMMGLKSTCNKRKVTFALANVNTAVRDIFRLTRIERFFTFY